jgi:DNA damage-binding protein 1
MAVSSSSQYSEPLILQRECGHHGHILALYIKTHGDFVLVGDLLRSVSLLQYKAADSSLEEVARDFNSNYMRAVEVLGTDDFFLGADDSGNFFSVRRQSEATTDEERGKMEAQGEFHLGDCVNVMRKGSLNSQPTDQDVAPSSGSSASASLSAGHSGAGLTVSAAGPNSTSILYGTVDGAIGTLITLSYESFVFFSTLERAIKTLVPAAGGLSHDDWRSFYNERRCTPQRNFVDGDLVETLLDLDRGQVEQIVRQMNDDMAAASHANVPASSSASASSASASATLLSVLSGNKATHLLTVEDCIRRVEDTARLH